MKRLVIISLLWCPVFFGMNMAKKKSPTPLGMACLMADFGLENLGSDVRVRFVLPVYEAMKKRNESYQELMNNDNKVSFSRNKEFFQPLTILQYETQALRGNIKSLQERLEQLDKSKPNNASRIKNWQKECGVLKTLIDSPQVKKLNDIAYVLDSDIALDHLRDIKETSLFQYGLQCYMERPKHGLLVVQDPNIILCDPQGRFFMIPEALQSDTAIKTTVVPKIENTMRMIFCTKDSLSQIPSQLSTREQMLSSGKNVLGKRLSNAERQVIKKEIESIKECCRKPGMKLVENMQKKSTTFHQVLWDYSKIKAIPGLDPVVKETAKITRASYPEYAAHKQKKLLAKQQKLAQQQALAQQQDSKASPVLETVQLDNVPQPLYGLNETDFTSNFATMYDLVQTTPTNIDSRVIDIFHKKVTANPKTDFSAYARQFNELLDHIESQGLISYKTIFFFAKDFAKCSAQLVAHIAEHPQEYASDFVKSQVDLMDNLAWLCGQPDVLEATTQEMKQWENNVQQRTENVIEIYNHLCETVPKMSRKDWAQVSARIFVNYMIFKSAGKGLGALKNLPQQVKTSPLIGNIADQVRSLAKRFPKEFAEGYELTLAEGGLPIKVPAQLGASSLFQKMSSEVVKGGVKSTAGIVKPLDYAHSAIQYEELKAALQAEEFTSIVEVTRHGLERLLERGFEPIEVKSLFSTPDFVKSQKNGARAFVKQVGENKYNFIVYNQEKNAVVTALKHINKQDLINLGKNYGWEL